LACLLAAALPATAEARCSIPAPPTKRVVVEEDVSSSSLTQGRGSWQENSLIVESRDGNTHSFYASAADDVRFGERDADYEAGAYAPIARHVIADVIAAFSPQHQVLPASSGQIDLDVRAGAGYGYQAGFATRNYATVNASIQHLGVDRYFRDLRLAGNVTVAHLNNVPGLALSEGGSITRYLACDTENFSVSTGRDVENTGVGTQLAVYHSQTFYAGDLHRLSSHVGLLIGVGWYELTGAYNRLEIRFALRERI